MQKKPTGVIKATFSLSKKVVLKVTKPVRKMGSWCLDKYVAWGEWSDRRGVTKANNATQAAVGVGAGIAVPAILGAKKGL